MTDPYNSTTVPQLDDSFEWETPDLFDTQRIRKAIDKNRRAERDIEDEDT